MTRGEDKEASGEEKRRTRAHGGGREKSLQVCLSFCTREDRGQILFATREGFVEICPEIVSSAVLRVPVLFLQKQKRGKFYFTEKRTLPPKCGVNWCGLFETY